MNLLKCQHVAYPVEFLLNIFIRLLICFEKCVSVRRQQGYVSMDILSKCWWPAGFPSSFGSLINSIKLAAIRRDMDLKKKISFTQSILLLDFSHKFFT